LPTSNLISSTANAAKLQCGRRSCRQGSCRRIMPILTCHIFIAVIGFWRAYSNACAYLLSNSCEFRGPVPYWVSASYADGGYRPAGYAASPHSIKL
jgi:hypothetical protein